ncbi:MAG: glycosyltransferase family 4 protein [Verrucomicrobiota bacterium]
MMKIAVLFDNFGPYHKARLQAVGAECDLLAIEFGAVSGEYAWANHLISGVRHEIVNPNGPSHALPVAEFRTRLKTILGDFQPDVVAVPGWASSGAFLAFEWCVRHRCPSIIMSDSTAWDEPRVAWKEWIKGHVVGFASSALVGGSPHAEYMHQLGMPEDRIFLGYDTVDNDYFAREAVKWRTKMGDSGGLPLPYFLASNRFIAKKNLSRLLEAYAKYSKEEQGSGAGRKGGGGEVPPPWPLCLLGDGELKSFLIAQCHRLGLEVTETAPWESSLTSDHFASHSSLTPLGTSGPLRRSRPTVFFPGFRQIDELPRFYAHAGGFVHASTTEQWGLVVNEAMAAGLPVIVSDRVGCARDLVKHGVNGFTFDPLDVNALAAHLRTVADVQFPHEAFSQASVASVGQWGCDRFAAGLRQAAEAAKRHGPRGATLIQRLLLSLLLRR